MRYILLYLSLIFLCGFSGITYKSYTHDPSTKIHVLILDPSKVTVNIVRAQDIGHGLAPVAEMAQRNGALAAINAGFFRLNQPISTTGLPAGILKINNTWHGIAYKSRGAVGWDPATQEVLFDIVQTDSRLEIAQQNFPIHVVNKILDGNRASLLSDSYIDHIKMIDNTSFIIADNKVTDVYTSGSILIPHGAYVYNVSGVLQDRVQSINIGDPVNLQVSALPLLDHVSNSAWDQMPNIVAGGPLLIKDGKIINDYKREQISAEFVNQRHARTAVGILENGDWIFVVVEKDSGMTIHELTQFMAKAGCVAALNLDGGGSSSMYVHDSIALRRPTILPDRPVADALVVLPKG